MKNQAENHHDGEWLVGALTQLQVRYPALIRQLNKRDLVIDLVFYLEDMALACSQYLLDEGISAVHRLDHPRVVSLQIPSLTSQAQIPAVIKILNTYLSSYAHKMP